MLSWFCFRYLHVTGDQFGRPIHGQREISGYSYPEPGNEWKTMVCYLKKVVLKLISHE